jgi:seryl-tRNA synthetase
LISSQKTTCSWAKALDMIDMERGVKLAGTRNYFLKGDGAVLHRA